MSFSPYQEEELNCLKADCEELKLLAEKSDQTVKNLALKLKKVEQEATPNDCLQADIKKLEATCDKLRDELEEEKTETVNAIEKLSKVQEVSSTKPE